MATDHHRFMQAALSLARRNLGQTWPNPCVGAVIVKDGQIIAQGVTARGGRPHAETEALAQIGGDAKGATLYVTLEPCSHHGKTPPCADAVIASGITRVVVACRDPNPLVAGKGIALLKPTNIEVIEGVCENEAREINRGFFSVIEKKRPFISLKIATSLDGKVATASGESQWITGEAARAYGHGLRSRYDAIATGIGTVLADDPQLTCRLSGREHASPVRVVFDSDGRLPADSQLAKTSKEMPVWLLTSSSRRKPGSSLPDSVRVFDMDPGFRRDDEIPIENAVKYLAEQGITRFLVEAGPRLSTAFLQSGLVDRMYWFRAPIVIGSDGLDVVNNGFAATLAQLRIWQRLEYITLGNDTLEIYERMDPGLRRDDEICSPAS